MLQAAEVLNGIAQESKYAHGVFSIGSQDNTRYTLGRISREPDCVGRQVLVNNSLGRASNSPRILYCAHVHLPFSADIVRCLSEIAGVRLRTTERQLTYLDWDSWRKVIPPRVEVDIERDLPDNVELPWSFYIRQLKSLKKSIREFQPDILHLQESFVAKQVVTWLLGLKSLKCPLVLTVHDPTPHLGEGVQPWDKRKWLQTALRKRADRIVTTAQVNKVRLQQMIPQIDEDRIAVVLHHVLDYYKLYTPPDSRQQEANLLFFGRMIEYKGVDTLAAAWPIIRQRNSNTVLTIAGTGPALDRHIGLFQNDDRIRVINQRTSNEEAARLFTESTAVLLPYKGATQSGVIGTALAFNRACVASNVGGIGEILEDGVSATLIPPNDPDALADATLGILANPEHRKRIERNVESLAADRLSPAQLSKELAKQYEAAIESRRRA